MSRGLKPHLKQDDAALTKTPPAPSWMSVEAKGEWKRVVPLLIRRRIITSADISGLENYCVAAGRVREIEAIFRRHPKAILHKALFGMQNRAMQTARQLAAEYGLSPTSRTKISNAAEDDSSDDINPLTIGRNRNR